MVAELCHDWFRYWFVAYSVPSHYPKQTWIIINLTLKDKPGSHFVQTSMRKYLPISPRQQIPHQPPQTLCCQLVWNSSWTHPSGLLFEHLGSWPTSPYPGKKSHQWCPLNHPKLICKHLEGMVRKMTLWSFIVPDKSWSDTSGNNHLSSAKLRAWCKTTASPLLMH